MMSPSSAHDLAWDNSHDVLQGIMGSHMAPSSQVDPSPNGLPSDLGDPASFLGLQFGPEPTVIPHNHASILNQWPSYHPSSSSSPPATSQHLEYPQIRHPRLTNDQDAWNPLQVTGVPTNPAALPIQPLGKPQLTADFDRRYSIGQYSTPSENGSYNGIHPSDSGYSSRSCTTRSVATSYAVDSACSPYLAPHEHEQDDRASTLDLAPVADSGEHDESPSLLCLDVIRCDYRGCQWTGKCPSDKRKHEARHRKLFKCDEPGCTRKEGFGTINDLARHKKCVHKQEPERGPKVLYMCFGQDCPRRNKKWPRLDNFRQHLARMHNDEDTDELLKRSHDWYENCVKPQELAQLSAERVSPATTTKTELMSGLVYPLKQSMEEYDDSTPVQASFQFSEDPYPDNHLENLSHLDQIPPRSTSQHLELPLKALNLNSLNHETMSTPMHLDRAKNDARTDEMVAEAATNMLNAMTKMINTNQRRRSQQTEDGEDLVEDNGALTGQKKEMLQRILSAALERLSRTPGPGQTSSHDVSDGVSGQQGWIQCEFCTKRTRLRCEMKKHKKRHERPYGCTFDRCNKTFGSKADWKRHENSQHFHLQSWRCTIHDASQGGMPCARLFYRQEIYVQHLRKHHHADEEAVREAICKNRMGRNGQSRFWCGFCRDIVPLRTQGIDAWNERFNHIDAEHFKKGERVDDWLLPSGHLTKSREREEEMKRSLGGGTVDEDDGEEEEEDGEGEEPAVEEDHSDDDSANSSYHSDSEGIESVSVSVEAESANLRKRKFAAPRSNLDAFVCGDVMVPNPKRYKIEPSSESSTFSMGLQSPPSQLQPPAPQHHQQQPHQHQAVGSSTQDPRGHFQDLVYCCQCMQGPTSLSYTSRCLYCSHSLCRSCSRGCQSPTTVD